MLVFTLTMPNCGSWNGRWSGEDKLYVLTVSEHSIGKKRVSELDGRSFFYRWDDGWTARVSVSKESYESARKLERKSDGFCGYDWMVKSIILRDKIEPFLTRKVMQRGEQDGRYNQQTERSSE